MTLTYLYGMDGLNLFTLIPLRSHQPDAPDTEMNFLPLAQLLMRSKMTDSDGTLKHSPVTKVSTNEEGSRCFLHTRKVDAARLICFTTHVALLMPLWLGGGITIRQNTTEADKVIRSGRTLESPATHHQTHQPASLPATVLHTGKEGDIAVSLRVRQPTTPALQTALMTPTLTNEDTANQRADNAMGAKSTTQSDPRTAIPAVFSNLLLHIQSAVASLTSMVREQALEIGELRKTIDRSAGIITITNATSDKR